MTHSRVESDVHARHRSQPARCPPRYRANASSPRPRKPCPAASAHRAPAKDPRTDPTDTRGPAPVGLARAFVAGVATGPDPREAGDGRPLVPSALPHVLGAEEPATLRTTRDRSRHPGAPPGDQPDQSTLGDAAHR